MAGQVNRQPKKNCEEHILLDSDLFGLIAKLSSYIDKMGNVIISSNVHITLTSACSSETKYTTYMGRS